jgi:hypothetical protein
MKSTNSLSSRKAITRAESVMVVSGFSLLAFVCIVGIWCEHKQIERKKKVEAALAASIPAATVDETPGDGPAGVATEKPPEDTSK